MAARQLPTRWDVEIRSNPVIFAFRRIVAAEGERRRLGAGEPAEAIRALAPRGPQRGLRAARGRAGVAPPRVGQQGQTRISTHTTVDRLEPLGRTAPGVGLLQRHQAGEVGQAHACLHLAGVVVFLSEDRRIYVRGDFVPVAQEKGGLSSIDAARGAPI